MCYEEGAGYMWWPWGAYGLPMGCMCDVREMRAACGSHGGHGVPMDYLWVVCVCVVRKVRVACGGYSGHRVCVDYLWVVCVL